MKLGRTHKIKEKEATVSEHLRNMSIESPIIEVHWKSNSPIDFDSEIEETKVFTFRQTGKRKKAYFLPEAACRSNLNENDAMPARKHLITTSQKRRMQCGCIMGHLLLKYVSVVNGRVCQNVSKNRQPKEACLCLELCFGFVLF